MARPKPSYEDAPIPSSVSVARKLREAGTRLRAGRPALAIQDFTDLVERALAEYIERHYPGLIETVAAELRSAATASEAAERMVAEESVASLAAKLGPSPEEMAQRELARRKVIYPAGKRRPSGERGSTKASSRRR